jgi:hypothetical protein
VDSLAIVTDGLFTSLGDHRPSYIVTWGLVDPVQARLDREVYPFIPMCVGNIIGRNFGAYTYTDWSRL